MKPTHMRHTTLALTLFTALGTASGQVINGSFEGLDGPEFTGWNWVCAEPNSGTGGAPGWGSWHAVVAPGQAKGCTPNYLTQPITGVMNGDRLTLSAWVRCDSEEPCLGGFIGIGRLVDGNVVIDDLTAAVSEPWAFISITDTIEIQGDDVPLIVITAGTLGGPIAGNPAHVDGVELEQVVSVNEVHSVNIRHYLDLNQRTLSISAGEEMITDVRLFDLTGRRVQVTTERNTTSTVHMELNGLPGGAYFAQVSTQAGKRTIRFTTW